MSKYFRRLVFDSVDVRMLAIRDLFEGGASEMTGKAKRAGPGGEFVGRFGGVKKSVPAVAHFDESPKRIAKAIRKGPRDPLYRKIREAVLEEVLIDEGEHIQDFVDLAPPAELDALLKKSVHERRQIVQAHVGRKNCKHCKHKHTFSIHLSHGKGAYKRTHGKRPAWVQKMIRFGYRETEAQDVFSI